MFNLINLNMMFIMIYLFNMFMYFYINKVYLYVEFELINLFSIKLEFLMLIDWISLLFISVVFLISLMVIFYSFEYMKFDKNLNRFILLMYLFVMSMVMMIISPNLISILIGWDGLGLVSFCLVIYYQGVKSFNSGMVTILTNRLGDILILISISLMMTYGSWNYMFLTKMNNFIYLMLMLASFTKSAQIPFSSWLPMAMAAPTPVSSLVHSSTLVTAGVYLLIRLNYLLSSKLLINYMLIISLITMFMSGLGASFEYDLKKIIALSTLSQLGVMIFCLSMKLMEISLFHLLMHAMFKSMLFMCAGVIIHNMGGNQDIRLISMTLYNLPMVSMMFNCSVLSLCGIPFMSGFFSKDLILEMFLMKSMMNKLILNLLFISMGLTIMYSFRLMFFSFISSPKLVIYYKYLSFKSNMSVSMILLFKLSILMGLMLSWVLFSLKNMIYLTIKLKLMIYLYMMIGIIMGMIFSKLFMNKSLIMYLNKLIIYFSGLWLLFMMYGVWVLKLIKFSEKLVFNLDLGWFEYLSVVSVNKLIKNWFKMDFYTKNYMYLLIMFMLMVMLILF